MRKIKFFIIIVLIISISMSVCSSYAEELNANNVKIENISENVETNEIQEETTTNIADSNIAKKDDTVSNKATENNTITSEIIENNTIPSEVIENNVVESEVSENKDFNNTEKTTIKDATALENLENENNINIISALTRNNTILENNEATIAIASATENNATINAKVSSVQITKRTTGVAPFDSDDNPGNDSSEGNDIVRTFDQVRWTTTNIMILKENATVEHYMGGTINVKATVPSSLKNYVKWDIDSMYWITNANVSSDGTILTGQYVMSSENATIPGMQDLIFVLNVYGLPNGTEIIPTFEASLEGNDADVASVTADSPVIVSAEPKYNVKLVRNNILNSKGLYDLETGNITTTPNETTIYGNMQGYGIIIQLYNDIRKGLKGIELPTGEISFDIVISASDTKDDTDLTNVDNFSPTLWDYKENIRQNQGKNGKNMLWNENGYTAIAAYLAPLNKLVSNNINECFDGGNWTLTDLGNSSYHVSINDYKFNTTDWVFPKENTGSEGIVAYTENIGCFSVGYIQVIAQYTESFEKESNLRYKVEMKNFNAKSVSNVGVDTDVVLGDNKIQYDIALENKGSVQKQIYFGGKPSTYWQPNWISWGDGTSYSYLGDEKSIYSNFTAGSDCEQGIVSFNILNKFDDSAIEIPLEQNGKMLQHDDKGGANSKILYAAKKDGTGWNNDEEMIAAQEEDLVYFTSLNDLIANRYTCVGYLIEVRDGLLNASDTAIYVTGIRVKNNEGLIGNTFIAVNNVRAWNYNIGFSWADQNYIYDKNTGITSVEMLTQYPEANIKNYTNSYKKTEYNEFGEKIGGHSGVGNGDTLLVIGGELDVTKKAIDEDGNEKKSYDLGKNEYDVKFQIKPSFSSDIPIANATIKITDILPKGMTYIYGSADYGEPEITYNSDGLQVLTWYLYITTSNNVLDTITYQVHLDETLENDKQLVSETIISELPDEDENKNEIYKISNNMKSTDYTIVITNLANFTCYKTTETPVIEENGVMHYIEGNGIIHYKVVAINNQNIVKPNFQLLDILPYNGDGRGTNFSGVYTVEKIELTQTDTTTGDIINLDNLSLYTTSDESVRSGVTAKDEDLGTTDIWQSYNSGDTINSVLTAYAIKGNFLGNGKLEVDIYLKAEENKPYDLYKNSVTLQIDKSAEILQTSNIVVQVVKRNLNGYVWFDTNMDGIINDGEKYIQGVKVKLLNEDGTDAIDTSGNVIQDKYTDVNGYYSFEDMVKGNYLVQIDWSETEALQNTEYSEILLTTKKVGANKEINSKFNSDNNSTGKTDTITTLNSLESPIISESHVNAGLYGTVTFEFTKVASEDTTVGIGGTKFALYELVCNEATHDHSLELIDISSVNENCWSLVNETTSSIGNLITGTGEGQVEFTGIKVNKEYRLVETKASLNRLLPKGQWKIVYNKENNDQVGNYAITAVGENQPPAFANDNNKLLLPNYEKHDLPFSGNIGTQLYKTTGLAIIVVAIYLLFVRRRVTVNAKSRYANKSKIARNTIRHKNVRNLNKMQNRIQKQMKKQNHLCNSFKNGGKKRK